MKLLIITTNICSVVGCASYRTAVLPGEVRATASGYAKPHVKIGSNVAIGLKSGKNISGKVLNISSNEIEIEIGKNYGGGILRFPISDIDSVRLRTTSDAKIERIWLWGIFGGIIVLLLSAGSGLEAY